MAEREETPHGAPSSAQSHLGPILLCEASVRTIALRRQLDRLWQTATISMTTLALAACGGKAEGRGAAGESEAAGGPVIAATAATATESTSANAPRTALYPPPVAAELPYAPANARGLDDASPSNDSPTPPDGPAERETMQAAGCGACGRRDAGDAAADSFAVAAMEAPAPALEPEPALDASLVAPNAFGGRQTFHAASCRAPDAGVLLPACPCNAATATCSTPDAGAPACTSTDLLGQTCEALGFAGGTPSCSGSCSVDTSECDTCVAGPRTLCSSLQVGVGSATKFALTASDTEIGLAWSDGNSTLHFTRLGANLTVLSDECVPATSIAALSVVSTSIGWLVAAHGNEQSRPAIFLYPFDRTGRANGAQQVVWGPQNGGSPCGWTMFIGGPTLSSARGRVLLTWVQTVFMAGEQLQSQLLADDGHTVGAPMLGALTTAIVATNDGFEIATNDYNGTRLSHVALDGTVRDDTILPSFDSMNLTWSGSTLRLLLQTHSGSVDPLLPKPETGFLERISQAGALLSHPTPIDAGTGYAISKDTLLAVGPDSVVHVTQSASSHYSEELVRFDSTGVRVLPPVPVVRANYAMTLQTVAQAGDAVVAWSPASSEGHARIELARVRLAP